MPRAERTDIGNYIYHILNRANARVQIFDNDQDYKLFENILNLDNSNEITSINSLESALTLIILLST